MNKPLNELTELELKAVAYDILGLLQMAQADLDAISKEIASRMAKANQNNNG